MAENSRSKFFLAIFLVIWLLGGLATGCLSDAATQTAVPITSIISQTQTTTGDETTAASEISTETTPALTETSIEAESKWRLTVIIDNYKGCAKPLQWR